MTTEKKEPVFVDGMIFQDPNEKAPEWVKFDLVINAEKFADFLKNNFEHLSAKGWLTITAKESKNTGKIYFEVNTWKPTPKETPQTNMTSVQPDGSEAIDTSGIPF